MLVAASIALLVERIAYRPLRGAPRLVPLISAIGASFFLQYTFRGLYGSGFQAYPVVKILEGHWLMGDFRAGAAEAARGRRRRRRPAVARG
jgi:branched-chain amino acid transport system permease protein